MSSRSGDAGELRLYGEHINLNRRSEEETRRSLASGKTRPRSALYASNLNPQEPKRRPFSAGTEPHSPTVLSFLRRAYTDRPDFHNNWNQDLNRDPPPIPGTVDSALLFNKLLRDPIKNSHQVAVSSRDFSDFKSKHIFGCDNISEISSVDTCVSLGTKIKNKAQSFKALPDSQKMNLLEGSSIKLKKNRSHSLSGNDKMFENSSGRKPTVDNENNELQPNLKLSIIVPHSKDDNTSSGVSSSSELQVFSYNQRSTTPFKKSHSQDHEDNDLIQDDFNTRQHKLSRSKRNPQISINWFPESYATNKEEDIKIEDEHDNCFEFPSTCSEDLTGRVSFGRNAFVNQNTYVDGEENNDYLDYQEKYNTQLSLVEEESSQESDYSPKLAFNELSPSTDENAVSYHKPIIFNDYKFPNYSDKFEKLTSNDLTKEKCAVPTSVMNSNNETSDEYEIERKFKILENKYRNDKSILEDVKSHSFGYKYEPVSRNGLLHSWTSLENVVSKENDSHSAKDSYESADLIKNMTDEASKYILGERDDVKNNKYNLKEKTDDFIKLSFPSEQNIDRDIAKDKSLYHEEDLTNIPNENSKLRESEKYGSKFTKIPDVVIDYSSERSRDQELNANKKYPPDNVVPRDNDDNIKRNAQEKTKSEAEPVEDILTDYPQYLEKSESKLYTSKVIEDYKKEIATINNFHELKLKDIRNELDTNHKTLTPNKSCDDFDEDDKDEKSIPDYEQKKYTKVEKYENNSSEKNTEVNVNGDISKFLNDYHKYKLNDERNYENRSFEKFAKEFIDDTKNNRKEPDPKIKSKKKTKKKGSTKYKNYNSNESTDSKYTETKRSTKSAPILKKDNSNNRVKFRAQKIVLSKSTTNINKTTYIDRDREVISWMASKIDTPFGESSSGGHPDTPTPDLEKEKLLNHTNSPYPYSYSTKENNVQIEKNIEPVIKSKPCIITEESQITTESSNENRKSDGIGIPKTRTKPKEVSFEKNDTTLNSWNGTHLDGNELSDLLEDDEMVSNIYSVLKEIEQNSTSMAGGDSVIRNSSNESDQNASAEYKDIVHFLENVESTANEEISALSHTQPPFSLKVEELMELSKSELAHRAVVGALAAGKAGAAAVRLRTALVSAANRAATKIRSERLVARQKANVAAQQSSQAIARHQKFIEQLINEKKTLAERIEQLVGAVSGAEARSARAARASAERLQLELKNQRQRLTQAHHRDKQSWLKQHTQKIKDMTVKGLEGEIQEMQNKHAAQLAAQQSEVETKLIVEQEKHAKEIRTFKESAARQLEDELDRERLLASERMELKRVEWESSLAAAADRAGAEGREAARIARREGEAWKEQQETQLEERRRTMERLLDDRKANMIEEISQWREKLTKEFEIYKEDYIKKQMEVMKEKEVEIRALSRRERDREIEKAIDTMEAEAQEGRKEMQETIRRIKAKYETDMKMLEESEQTAMHRCKEARELLRDAQEQCALNQITITQLEGKLRQADELKVQTLAEMEMSMRTVELRGREEVEDMRAQMMGLQQQHKDEMHQLYAKVKVAVAKKDDALTAARRDAVTLRDRCLRLEARLATS